VGFGALGKIKCAAICVGLWVALQLFLFREALAFFVRFSVCFLSVVSSFRVRHNVLQLGEVAEIKAQMFSFAQKFNRRTAVEFITKPAILPNCCWAIVIFYLFIIFLCSAFKTFGF
jgi:hypothetical protein